MRFCPRCFSVVVLGVLTALSAASQPAPPMVQRGVSGVFAPGSSFSLTIKGAKSPQIELHSVTDTTRPPTLLDGTLQGGDSFKYTLPASGLNPGPYYFKLVEGGEIVPGGIDIEGDKIKLLSVQPATAYKGDTDKFDFDVTGENFSTDPENDNVSVDGREIIGKGNAVSKKEDCAAPSRLPCLWVENERSMHVIGYSPRPYQGVVSVGIRVGSVTPADRQRLVLARHSGTVVFLLSAAVTGILFWIISWVVGSGLTNNKVARRRMNLYQSFIFDNETNSYSLSKFQLLVFSGTFIFGYIYVLLSRLLVQWQFQLPDVPSTIAGLLGISAGTTVASAGLTASRGAKGAGLQHPTGADLITTGGVVVPERFQFFVWTIVACAGFIALLIEQDPAKVNDFPTIPQGLLYVMGVSAAGYLGGKAARNAGPSLENIGIQQRTEKTPWIVLLVQGQNLATDGRFFIDEQELKFPTDEEKKKTSNLPDKLVSGVPQAGASDPRFCVRLDIIVVSSSIDLTKGDHTFRIVNRDGQFADLAFSASMPAITAVFDKGSPPLASEPDRKQILASDKEVSVVVRGLELMQGSTVGWRSPGKSDYTDASAIPGAPGDGTELWVSLVPGTVPETGVIMVTTPKGFSTIATVKVVEAGSQSSMPSGSVQSGAAKPTPTPAPPPENTAVSPPATSGPTPSEGQHPPSS